MHIVPVAKPPSTPQAEPMGWHRSSGPENVNKGFTRQFDKVFPSCFNNQEGLGLFFLPFLFNSLLLNIHLFIDEIIILHQTSRVLSREEEGGVNTSTVLQGAGGGIDGSIQVWLGLGGISFLQFLLLAAGLDLMGLQKTKGKESNLLLTTHWGPASPSPWTVSLQLALVTK